MENAVLDVLRSGRWAISGPYKGTKTYERRFAEAFAEFNGAGYCVPTTSGTAALTIALLAVGVGFGCEVLVPGLTWVACASSVLNIGAIPVLVDIDPETLAISLNAARDAITERTRAIMIVHPYCRLADIPGFVQLAQQAQIPLIEDCSQSHGAIFQDQRVGTFGSIGCFSMQQSKVLTSGEGGAAITNDPDLFRRMEQLRCDGRLFADRTPDVGHLELVEVGEVQGRNLCLSEFQAAILLYRLPHLDLENRVRLKSADLLSEMLSDICGVGTPPIQPNTIPTYYNFVFRVDVSRFGDCSVDLVARALTAELGVLCSPAYRPLNNHPLYAPLKSAFGHNDSPLRNQLDPSRFSLPNAVDARQAIVSIPHHVLLDSDESSLRDISRSLQKIQTYSYELLTLPRASMEAF